MCSKRKKEKKHQEETTGERIYVPPHQNLNQNESECPASFFFLFFQKADRLSSNFGAFKGQNSGLEHIPLRLTLRA